MGPASAGPAFLHQYGNTIRTLRAQIVSNPPPVWPQEINDILEPPTPPLGTHMQLFTLLAADALAQYGSKNDAAAWADLHAVWTLSQSLWHRPETMSIATALVGGRVIAAVAANIDPPLPSWWAEFASFDVRVPLLHSIEYEAWAMRMRAERYPLGEPDGSRFGDAIRRVADAVAKSDPCEPFVISQMPEWSGFVRRFNRFRIEREGVHKFLTRNYRVVEDSRPRLSGQRRAAVLHITK